MNLISEDPNRIIEVIEAINEIEKNNWTDGITKTWDGFWKDGIIVPRMIDGYYTCIVPETYEYLLTEYEKQNAI